MRSCESLSSKDKSSFVNLISVESQPANSDAKVTCVTNQDILQDFDRLSIKRKGGRPRKTKKLNFLDLLARRPRRKSGSLKYKSGKTKKNKNKQSDEKTSQLQQSFKDKDILSLGLELGLETMFYENDTLAVIQKRLLNRD